MKFFSSHLEHAGDILYPAGHFCPGHSLELWLCKQCLLTLCWIALTSGLCFYHRFSAMFDYTFPVTFSGLYFWLLALWSSDRRDMYQRSSRSLTRATGWIESLGCSDANLGWTCWVSGSQSIQTHYNCTDGCLF